MARFLYIFGNAPNDYLLKKLKKLVKYLEVSEKVLTFATAFEGAWLRSSTE